MFQPDVLKDLAGKADIKMDEPMSRHTTFRIGGPADIYIEPYCIEDFVNIVRYLQKEKCKYFIMGNGSNLLVKDEGYRGVIVSTRKRKDIDGNCGDKNCGDKRVKDNKNILPKSDGSITIDDVRVYREEDGNDEAVDFFVKRGYAKSADDISGKSLVYAASGILLSGLSSVIAENSLTGFEFAGGIPGTLGGAVTMNAGAYGGEIKDVIMGVRVLLKDGTIKVLSREELKLSYRSSIIQKENMIVLDALFAFDTGDREQILAQIRELNQRRRDKQPLEHGSAGSTFKRPEGYFAGRLIQDAGLKGHRYGDIMVSEKHSGFVVNVGNGTYKQAMHVIAHVKSEVKEKFGVELELEVKLL